MTRSVPFTMVVRLAALAALGLTISALAPVGSAGATQPHRCADIGSRSDKTLEHFPTLTRIRVRGTSCATPRSFARQLHAATYKGSEDWMWRQLATMRDPLGRRYRCFYQVVTTDTQFYTRMMCRHGVSKVNAWVNSAT